MDEDAIVRVLIASDIHAGYAENKEYVGNDSLESLREVLFAGAEANVDFVLLAGDLFHENHPSRETQLRVVRLLRKYCLGERGSDLDFLSDPTINFQHSTFPVVNYRDPNLRVSMPLFTIHGNHDDLSGKGLSSLDVLHETGLINLFGKFFDVDHIVVSPILFRRGNTKVALYGIGSQRDDRLTRAFSKGRVKFIRPEGEDPDSWFNILVLHQNRPPRNKLRTTQSHLPFKYIPPFFDIVIWGHEHECLIDPDFRYLDPNDSTKGFYIIQPGSTIATALSPEEAGQKHIGILLIRGKEFKMKKIPLKTTRQILIDELILEEAGPMAKISRSTVRQKNMPDEPLIEAKIEKMLKNAEESRGPQQPHPPRLRLRVVYSGKWLEIPPINGRKFGTKYSGRVANDTEMISVRTIREEKKGKEQETIDKALISREDDVCSVDDMINAYFNKCSPRYKLSILSEVLLGKQLQEYSNAEINTQYKFTTADKAMSENIKGQIDTLIGSVKQMIKEKLEQDLNDESSLEDQVAKCVSMAKKQRVIKTEEKESFHGGTMDTSFFEPGFDPSRMITSTPLPSQNHEAHQGRPMKDVDDADVILVEEDDFSPSP